MALDNDDIKQLIAILQRGLTDDDETEVEPQQKTKQKPKIRAASKKKPKPKANANKFESMPEFSMFKEDTEFDKKIRKPPPSARNREFTPIIVRCRICGKQEEVAPSLIESIDRYKCNKCSTGAG